MKSLAWCLFLSTNLVVNFPQNVYSQATCQATVNKVMQKIRLLGVEQVKFYVSQREINAPNNPTNRKDKLAIAMIETTRRSYQVIENILNSDRLMNSWADEIVKNCTDTAVVIIGLDQSDYVADYYIQADGTTKLKVCADEPQQNHPWGVGYCP